MSKKMSKKVKLTREQRDWLKALKNNPKTLERFMWFDWFFGRAQRRCSQAWCGGRWFRYVHLDGKDGMPLFEEGGR